MDMNALMNNPLAAQLMQRLQSDPELMASISRPDIMGRLQSLMSNPAAAQQAMANDPELQAIMQRMMGGGAGVGAGMGAGDGMPGVFPAGGNPWDTATAPPASSSRSAPAAGSGPAYLKIHSASQYHAAIKDAGRQLVVVDVSAEWCGPCKMIYPTFAQLAADYRGRVLFLKVDGDECHALVQELGVTGYPTFLFIVQGNTVDKFSGADVRRLRQIVADYGDRQDVKPCPYRHFPLKDTELVKYPDMKWDAVEAKFDEYNAKLAADRALDVVEKAELDVIIQKLQNKANYHSSTFTDAQYAVVHKLLTWPTDCLGPVLNLLRLFVLHPHVAQVFSKQIVEEKQPTADVVSTIDRVIVSAEKAVTSMLGVRVLCNFFSRRLLSKAIGARFEEVFDAVLSAAKRFEDDGLRASCFALYINFTLLIVEDSKFYEQAKVQLLSSMPEQLALPKLSAVLVYRLLVVLGTLLYEDSNTTELAAALEIPAAVEKARDAHPTDQQVKEAAKEVLQALAVTK